MIDNKLTTYLQMVLDQGASDLHIAAGSKIQLRIDGDLKSVTEEVLDGNQAKELCYQMMEEKWIKSFEQNWELDAAIQFGDKARFRVNLSMNVGTVCGAYRPIPTKIPDPKALGVPQIAMELAKKPRGLVLVTGPTGSGKSTSLAAMVNQINQDRFEHIITIEDPIEFIHQSKNCLVNQREVEKDTQSFGAALKRVLRQDPDVVLIGEMRDIETIGTAITVSETGHLVFATLHTNTAVTTINRIIDVFPPHQQPQVRTQLSFILEGIISQQLVPKANGGRALATEILIPTPAIRNLIREDKVHQIYAAMQMNQAATGMHTMSQSLNKLVKDGSITKAVALDFATEIEEMKKLLG